MLLYCLFHYIFFCLQSFFFIDQYNFLNNGGPRRTFLHTVPTTSNLFQKIWPVTQKRLPTPALEHLILTKTNSLILTKFVFMKLIFIKCQFQTNIVPFQNRCLINLYIKIKTNKKVGLKLNLLLVFNFRRLLKRSFKRFEDYFQNKNRVRSGIRTYAHNCGPEHSTSHCDEAFRLSLAPQTTRPS